MGVNIKTAGGICIGGILGFYLINKALNFTRQSIAEITEASKWKHYYKNGHMGKMVPPGYSEMPVPGEENREYVHPDVARQRKHEEEAAQRQAEREANRKPLDTNTVNSITDTVERIAKAFFKTKGIDLDLDKKPAHTTYADYCKNHPCPVTPLKDYIPDDGEADNNTDPGGDYDQWKDNLNENFGKEEDVHQVTVEDLVEDNNLNDIPDEQTEEENDTEE